MSPLMDHFDVVVAGGGPSGSLAAIAAARQGAKTLLFEQYAFLGGSLTAMGVGPMMSFHNPAGEQVVRGIPQELIERLMKAGGSPGHVPDSTTYCSFVTPFDSEALKLALEEMVIASGASVLFHTQLADVKREERRLQSIRLCNKSGLTRISANVWIDATGDGDLATRAGVPFEWGNGTGNVQPMTMNLKVGNVDRQRLLQAVFDQPENFAFENGADRGLQRLREGTSISLCGFLAEWKAAKERKEITIPRDNVLFFETGTEGVFIFNTTRITGFDATDAAQLSRAEIEGRRQCQELFRFIRTHCAGFENCVRIDASAQIGVRESRHVKGLHTLTAEELLTQRDFPDSIACGGYPIDIHSSVDGETFTQHVPETGSYKIPLRSLLAAGVDNLILAGRNISATHEASAAIRVTPIAMAIGQAAGTTAALATRNRVTPLQLDPEVIREVLRADGACL